ncbi:MAG TPA: DNA sulfur modification protein DndD, partial [Desulfosporosinus sp.]|nr:DNA sulfur modification protein DndD [Desulfosporosinus sp.]
GMNGRGKTTFLEAILLALYGRRSFAFAESKMSFPNYLKSLVNIADGTSITFVEMLFKLSSGEDTNYYNVKREWSLHSTGIKFTTSVYKNDTYDQVLSENWNMFVEEMLPSAIAPFFFFDGEKISELAVSDDDTYMLKSIKTLLGIDVLDQAMLDIQRIITSKKKTIKSDIHAKEITLYDEKIEAADSLAKAAAETLGHLKIKEITLAEELEKAENDFISMGGNLASNQKELMNKKSVLELSFEKLNDQLRNIVSEDLPLLMVLPLLNEILHASDQEREQRGINGALAQLPILYREFDKTQTNELKFDEFIQFVNSISKDVQMVYNLSNAGYFQLKTFCDSLPRRQKTEILQILERRQNLLKQLAEVENYLSIDVDEISTGTQYKKVLELTAQLATVKEKSRISQEDYTARNTQSDNLRREQLKVIEKAVACLESVDETRRIMTYAGRSLQVLLEYKIRLQVAKTRFLAETMTKCFKQIVAKQNLIGNIQIDPNTLKFIYLNQNGEQLNRSSFSAGEKQLLMIAMLWALGICSKKQLPVIIDTPLARLDSAHRESLITNYFPNASEQMILLSTDSEVYGKYYDMLRPYVGREFTLKYNDTTQQTVVDEGYFGGLVK